MQHGLSGLFLVATFAGAQAEITLTDLQGRNATIEVSEVTPTVVSFVMQGRKGTIKVSDLTPESRTAVVTYAQAKNVFRSFPPVTVQVKVAVQRRNSEKSSYETNAKLISSTVIEGTAKLLPVPAATATIVLITQDTREKYANHVEKLMVWATDTVEIPAAENGDRREFPFQTAELVYDLARDPSNIGGNEYKYFIFGLRDAATRQFIDFQSNCPSVQNYVTRHPEARETLLGLRKRARFTTDFPAR